MEQQTIKPPKGNLWLDTFFARKTTVKVKNQNLEGKLIVFTGGTDGMGRVAVERFAEMGADLCLFGRNPTKTQRVADELIGLGHAGKISIVRCDLSSLAQVREAAAQVLERHDQIHYLIGCAGLNAVTRTVTEEGFEMNFVVNYLSPYLLTELLVDRITQTPVSRIVNLASATQEVGKLEFDNLQRETGWSTMSSYAQAKLCLIMHSRDLAKRIDSTGTTVNCLNPGYIKSNLTRSAKGFQRFFMKAFGELAAPTWVGGERIVAAALDQKLETVSGKFIYEDVVMDPNPQALDDASVARLMDLSRKMAGLTAE